MGGTVRKSDKGWGVGIHDYQVVDWPGAPEHRPARLDIQAYHQDQVIVPPPGTRRIASSDFCPNAGLWYPGFAVTVQGHPEFPAGYAEALIKARRSTSLGEEVADKALSTVHDPANADAVAQLVGDFLDAPREGAVAGAGDKTAG